MVRRILYTKKAKFYYYATYTDERELYRTIKRARMKTGTKYLVNKQTYGYLFPKEKYHLYFNKVINLTP